MTLDDIAKEIQARIFDRVEDEKAIHASSIQDEVRKVLADRRVMAALNPPLADIPPHTLGWADIKRLATS